jgi:hypothetical protein
MAKDRTTINVRNWEFERTYTSEPMPELEPWNGATDLDIHKYEVARFIRCETARRSPMLLAKDQQGRSLYQLTESGVIRRAFPLSQTRKREVKERDGRACVWCGSTKALEVDHIVRYVDGGGNDMSNLRTLCHDCHAKRGGRA